MTRLEVARALREIGALLEVDGENPFKVRAYEAVAGILEKRIDGFGELFRALSYAEIGAAAMLSRAVAGVWGGRAIFSVPGSKAAVRLAWEKLIAPEAGHVVRELRKDAARG